jgi:hypothetical protein
MRFTALAGPMSLLAACGAVDDPANIPRLGNWEDVTTVDSVTLDGRSIPEEQLPEAARKMIADMRKTERKCAEPLMRSKAEVEALMSERLDRTCNLVDYNPSGGRISGMAHCEGRVIAGFDTEPTVKIDGTVDEDRVKLNVQSIIRINQKTGASNLLVMAGRRTFRRLGDC